MTRSEVKVRRTSRSVEAELELTQVEQARDNLRAARSAGSPVLLAYSRIRKASGYWLFVLTRRGISKADVKRLVNSLNVSVEYNELPEIFLEAQPLDNTGLHLKVAADVDPEKLSSAIWLLNRHNGMSHAIVDFGNSINITIRNTETECGEELAHTIRQALYDAQFNNPKDKLARLPMDRERLRAAFASLIAHLEGCSPETPDALNAIWTSFDPKTRQTTLHARLNGFTVSLPEEIPNQS
jgi:hypothetical protein